MEKRCPGCMKMKTQSPICEHCGYNETVDNLSHQLPVGTLLRGQYVIGKALGQGGFGITYLGWDKALEQKIAIKEYFPNGLVNRECSVSTTVSTYGGGGEASFLHNRERFLQEGKTLAKLGSIPGIVKIHTMFEENSTAYIVMEYVEGVDLRRFVQMAGGRLGVQQTLTILKPVMEALQKVHKAELVHRDISPDNIMLLPDGSAKLLDFGAAREVLAAGTEKELAQSTEAVLKHGFAPIEQYQKRGALGPWTDVYALCGTIYYCLTGKVPTDAPERMVENLEVGWDAIPGLTQEQAELLEAGMALRARDRLRGVEALLQGLYELKEPKEEEIREKQTVSGKKRKIKPILAGVAALIAAAGLFLALGADQRPQAPEVTRNVVMETIAAPTLPPVTTQAPETLPPETTGPVEVTWLENVMMPDPASSGRYINGVYDFLVLGNQNYGRSQIASITVLDSMDPVNWAEGWDVSLQGNQSVMAWVEPNGELYDLYIAADGGVMAPENCSGLFMQYLNAKAIRLKGTFHTEQVTNMTGMFSFCHSLKTLDLSGFETAGVTDMTELFRVCLGLESVDLRGWETGAVTSMYRMFDSCPSLKTLDLSNLDTARTENMAELFSGCENLESLNLSGWDTGCVLDMSAMFRDCKNLKNLDLRGFDTTAVREMGDMFRSCGALPGLELGDWEIDGMGDDWRYWQFMDEDVFYKGVPWKDLFRDSPAPESEAAWQDNLLMADISDAIYYDLSMLPVLGNHALNRFDIRSITFLDTQENVDWDTAWDASQRQDKSVMAWTAALETGGYDLYIAGEGGVCAPKSCRGLFSGYQMMKRIDFNGAFHTENTTDMKKLFYYCQSLEDVDLAGIDTGKVTDMSEMFADCCGISRLELSWLNTAAVTTMEGMFRNCGAAELNFRSFETAGVTSMKQMFADCRNLENLDLSSFDTASVETMGGMFLNCKKLKNLDLSAFDTAAVSTMEEMFLGCGSIPGLELGDWETDRIKEAWQSWRFMDEDVHYKERPWEELFQS